MRGVLVVGHRRRVGPSNRDFLHQWRGSSREVTREVVLPLIVEGIQYVVRGGTAWWRLPVEFWSTGTVCPRSSLAKDRARNSPRNSSQGSADLGFDEHVCTRRDTGIRTIRCNLRYPFGSDGT